jgi:hypothetical protein
MGLRGLRSMPGAPLRRCHRGDLSGTENADWCDVLGQGQCLVGCRPVVVLKHAGRTCRSVAPASLSRGWNTTTPLNAAALRRFPEPLLAVPARASSRTTQQHSSTEGAISDARGGDPRENSASGIAVLSQTGTIGFLMNHMRNPAARHSGQSRPSESRSLVLGAAVGRDCRRPGPGRVVDYLRPGPTGAPASGRSPSRPKFAAWLAWRWQTIAWQEVRWKSATAKPEFARQRLPR